VIPWLGRLMLLAAISVVMAVTPALASARYPKLRDPSGRVAGVLNIDSFGTATVSMYPHGIAGRVGKEGLSEIWQADFGSPFFPLRLAKTSATRWGVYNWSETRITGFARRTSSRWVIKRRVGGRWKLMGTAPRSLAGQYAIGAGRLLFWGPERSY
jgi:hypothetical protein